ncbi:hypothetical protein DPMN_161085 [Dreissena polymorpha]|uniref:Uncharacterized protein n=1 Tax=Dreissena polymorpha TaxID=45954 RepID=A0A9D4ISB7_DREPO|nr:hypothetical protein DPMN_161085 [Dreissena polymorpha]
MVVVLSAPREVLVGVRAGYRQRPDSRGVPGSFKCPVYSTDTLHPLLTSLAEDMLGAPRRSPVRPVGYALRRGNYRSAVISVPRSGRDTAVRFLWAGSGEWPHSHTEMTRHPCPPRRSSH